MADFVARSILPVLGELDGKAFERAFVQARHDALNHEPREQLKASVFGKSIGRGSE